MVDQDPNGMGDFVGAVEGVSAAIVVIRREFDLHLIMRITEEEQILFGRHYRSHVRCELDDNSYMHDEICRSRCQWQYICEQRGMTRSLHETD